MLKGNKKLFTDKTKLTEMLNLRLIGLSYNTLASMYGCDWTSIKAQCHKYFLPKPAETYALAWIVSQVIPKQKEPTFKIVNGERINLGRNYKDYLISP